MRARGGLAATCAAAIIALAAGCAGGGDAPVGDMATTDVGIPAPAGVGADRSAATAIAALGPPGPVDPHAAGHTLSGADAMGAMRDVFSPLVRPARREAAPAPDAAAAAAPPPALTVPTVAVPPPARPAPAPAGPPATTSTTPAAPTAPTTPATATAPAAPAPPADATSGWRPAREAVVEEHPGAAAGRLRLRAELDIDGEIVVAGSGDAVPPESQAFTVISISAAAVVLRLDGGLLADGTDTLTLALGEEVTLQNAVSGRAARLTLVGIRTP